MEPGGAFGDQRPVPGPLAAGGVAPGGVEGDGSGVEVAGRPGPLGLDQPQQVPEVLRRVRGAGGQPPRHLIQFGQQIAAFITVAVSGLPGEGQPAQQVHHSGRVGARDRRHQRLRRRAVPRQASRIAEDGGGSCAAEMRVEECDRVARVPVGGRRLSGRGCAFAP